MPGRSSPSEIPSSPQQEVARLAGLRAVHSAFLYLHNQEMEFRRWQLELARVPAPPFGEADRSQWLQQRFLALGLHQVQIDALGNVSGLLYENRQPPLIALSAHLDTVFPSTTKIECYDEGNRLFGPGIS